MKNAERKANAQTKKSKERKYSEGEKASVHVLSG